MYYIEGPHIFGETFFFVGLFLFYVGLFLFYVPSLSVFRREGCCLIWCVVLGIYAAPILDAIHFSASSLLYMFDSHIFIYATSIFIASYNTPVPQVFRVYLIILKYITVPGLE